MLRGVFISVVISSIISVPACRAGMTGAGFNLANTEFNAAGDGTVAVGDTTKLVGRLGVSSVTKMTGGGYELGPGVLASQRPAQNDLSAAHAYPIPFVPRNGDREIVFTRLPARATIKIFTISGELVKKLEKNSAGTDRVSWYPVANERGNPVASGVYLWVAEDNAKKTKVGKLMIIK